MRRLAALALALALLAPAAADAAPVRVDRLRHSDGVAFTLRALPKLNAKGEGRFGFTAKPPEGDTGPYGEDGTIDVPPVGLASKPVLLVGTAIACAAPTATAVYGTVRRRARRIVATTVRGRSFRLRRVRAPEPWDFGGRVVGRVVAGRASIARVVAFTGGGRSMVTARFRDPLTCRS